MPYRKAEYLTNMSSKNMGKVDLYIRVSSAILIPFFVGKGKIMWIKEVQMEVQMIGVICQTC